MKIKNLLIIFFALFVSLSLSVGANAQKKKVAITKKTAVITKSDLSVEAGLVFKNGDVKPAARIELHLLDADLEEILKDSGIKLKENDGTYISLYDVLEYGSRKYGIVKDELLQARNAIKPHIIATMTTDFNGKGEFSSIKSGKYFLMGVGGTGSQAVIWNVPIDIKTGKQSLTLDNDNAAEIF